MKTTNSLKKTSTSIEYLIQIMRALRDPDSGCPWDIEQTFETIAPYTIEEAYEVADAINRRNMSELKDELGDLLLQVVYHTQIACILCCNNYTNACIQTWLHSNKQTKPHIDDIR